MITKGDMVSGWTDGGKLVTGTVIMLLCDSKIMVTGITGLGEREVRRGQWVINERNVLTVSRA